MPERRLAAILFTDVVGYTALMAQSEATGLRVRERHREVVRLLVRRYHGESIEARGDESLSTFPTALDAVSCALAIQEQLEDDPELKLHLGIHLGDLVVLDGEVSGDGVNIASRLCALSEGGGLRVSGEVYRSIRNQPAIEASPLGERKLKNVPDPVAVYSVSGTAAEPRSVSPAVRGRSRHLLAAALAGLLVVGLGLGWWLTRQPPELAPIRSIAVLPLANLSGDPEQEYFSDGMTDLLIGELARIGALRVISRTSVMHYKQTDKLLPQIARELNVDAIVEGTLMRAGDQVRITAQLIDARNDQHLWAESYERDWRDVFELQSQVAQAIAREIEVELTSEEQTRLSVASAVIPEAHEAYLKGRYFLDKTTHDDTVKALEFFEEAIRLDPSFALGYSGMANAYS